MLVEVSVSAEVKHFWDEAKLSSLVNKQFDLQELSSSSCRGLWLTPFIVCIKGEKNMKKTTKKSLKIFIKTIWNGQKPLTNFKYPVGLVCHSNSDGIGYCPSSLLDLMATIQDF